MLFLAIKKCVHSITHKIASSKVNETDEMNETDERCHVIIGELKDNSWISEN